jgi:hypothetical protein
MRIRPEGLAGADGFIGISSYRRGFSKVEPSTWSAYAQIVSLSRYSFSTFRWAHSFRDRMRARSAWHGLQKRRCGPQPLNGVPHCSQTRSDLWLAS